jgi:hypothetical protein
MLVEAVDLLEMEMDQQVEREDLEVKQMELHMVERAVLVAEFPVLKQGGMQL